LTTTVDARSSRPDREELSSRACWRYAAFGALFMLAYFVNPHGGGLPGWAPRFPLYICVNAAAVVAVIVGIRRWRPEPALPWWLMAVGQAVYTAGDFLFYWARYISHVEEFPGIADVFYLGRIPFMVVALALIIRRRSGRDRAAVIDCLIVGVAAGVMSWVFLMEPFTAGALGLSVRFTALAYPVTDLMLVAMTVRLLAGVGRRGTSFYLLTGGLIVLGATDSVYTWLNIHGVAYGSGSIVEGGWLLYYLTVGACALHPSMRGLATADPREREPHSRARLAALGAAALACPVLLAVEASAGQRVHALPIAFGSIAAFGLVMLRLADVMHRQQRAEAQLRYQAFHDSLTGLANRALFYDRLEHALELSRRSPRGLAVLLIDLDRFKPINDSLGHAAGDELLVAVADRISGCMRSADTAGRLGGDEFVVLAEGVATVEEARGVAERVIEVLSEPLSLAGTEISVRASIGVAFAPTAVEDADELLNNADAAMYTAKREAAGTCRVFEPAMHAATLHHVGLDAELRRALTDRELTVHYQPISSVETGKVSRVEALVRWEHPQRGLLAPAEFIPAAEASGLIVAIGTFVLREACRQVRSWHDTWPGERLQLNVNLSARELAEADLVPRVEEILHDAQLEARFLTFELTEGVLLADPAHSARLWALKELGVGLAVDDFGTGFSSLSHLRLLPVDTLKIDKSFVDTVATDSDGFGFVQAIVGLARTLRLTTVAEGVEEPDQLRCLRRAGCDLMQGHLLARPLPPADLEAIICRDLPPDHAVPLAATTTG
jgi:diguanylate cyclase (GGDEF)-like protein